MNPLDGLIEPGLEDLRVGARYRWTRPVRDCPVVHVEWYDDQAAKITFEDSGGTVANRLVYRDSRPQVELVTSRVSAVNECFY